MSGRVLSIARRLAVSVLWFHGRGKVQLPRGMELIGVELSELGTVETE